MSSDCGCDDDDNDDDGVGGDDDGFAAFVRIDDSESRSVYCLLRLLFYTRYELVIYFIYVRASCVAGSERARVCVSARERVFSVLVSAESKRCEPLSK